MMFRIACLFAVVDAVEDAEAMLQTVKLETRTAMQLVEEGKQLSEHLLVLAENSTDVTRNLLQSFRICGQCEHFERFGEPDDGGYLTCMDSQEKIVGALSLGVEGHDQWTLDVHGAFGVKVGQFDCTVDSGTECGGDCEFFKKCIGSADGHGNSAGLSPMVTVEQAVKMMQFDAAAEGSLLMKMDIEGSEWPIYEVESADVLKKFRQIIVEFHWFEHTERHAQMLQAMTTLREAGFSVVHLHGNNYEGQYVAGKFQVPNVLEVTFLSNAAQRQECASWEALPADAPNTNEFAELQPAKLPNF